MKLNEFINKYTRTSVDFDNAYGAQCVDLFRQYCKDVLNIHHTGAVEGAKDLFLDYNKLPLEQKYFSKIYTTDVRYGDVGVWDKTATNEYGHVAVIVSLIDNGTALIFEQDGFKQDGAKLSLRSMTNFLGVLRAKED